MTWITFLCCPSLKCNVYRHLLLSGTYYFAGKLSLWFFYLTELKILPLNIFCALILIDLSFLHGNTEHKSTIFDHPLLRGHENSKRNSASLVIWPFHHYVYQGRRSYLGVISFLVSSYFGSKIEYSQLADKKKAFCWRLRLLSPLFSSFQLQFARRSAVYATAATVFKTLNYFQRSLWSQNFYRRGQLNPPTFLDSGFLSGKFNYIYSSSKGT